MANLQVRSIDEQLYKALGQRAAMENRSISQEVVTILQAYLSRPENIDALQANRAFLGLCGSWQDERDAAEISEDLRLARRHGGRFSGQELF